MQSEEERGTSDDLSHYFLCAPTQSQSAAGDEGETSRAKSDKTRRTDAEIRAPCGKFPPMPTFISLFALNLRPEIPDIGHC